MIELTLEQVQAIERGGPPSVMVNPKTREEFVLLPKERFEVMQKWIAPLKRRWDDPADDALIREDRDPTPQPQDDWERRLLGAASDCGVALSHEAVSSEGLYD